MTLPSVRPQSVIVPFSASLDGPDVGGGVQTFVRMLCAVSSEVGLEVTVLGVGPHESHESSVHFSPVLASVRSESEYVRGLKKFVRTRGFQVPEESVILANAEHYSWALRTLHVPTVLLAHGVVSETLRIRRGRLSAFLFRAFIEPRAIRNARRVICVTDRVREYYTHRYDREPPEKFVSMSIGVELGAFEHRPRGSPRKDFAIDEDSSIVLFVGRLSPEKNVSLFLAAGDHLASSGQKFNAVVVGEGPEGDRLAATLSKRPWLRWVPRTSHDQVLDLMAVANVLAITSTYEGLPIVLLEALGSGLPVVSTDVGRARHFLRGATGVVVEPDPAAFARALREALLARRTKRGSIDPAIRTAIDFRTTARSIATILRQVRDEASVRRAVIPHARQRSWDDKLGEVRMK